MARDTPEPRGFPSLRCQKRLLRAHKEVYLVPYPAVGIVLQVGDAVKLGFLHVVRLEAQFLFSESASRVHASQP